MSYCKRRPYMVAGFAKLAKGAGLKILSRRSSRVRIPYPALNLFLMSLSRLCIANIVEIGIMRPRMNLSILIFQPTSRSKIISNHPLFWLILGSIIDIMSINARKLSHRFFQLVLAPSYSCSCHVQCANI